MSYKEGREYISPLLLCWLLLAGVDSDEFFDGIESPKPFPDDSVDNECLMLDDNGYCIRPPKGEIEHGIKKPLVVAMESVIESVANMTQYESDDKETDDGDEDDEYNIIIRCPCCLSWPLIRMLFSSTTTVLGKRWRDNRSF